MPKKLLLDPRDAHDIAEVIHELLQSEPKTPVKRRQSKPMTKLLSKRMYLNDDSSTRIEEPLSQAEIAKNFRPSRESAARLH